MSSQSAWPSFGLERGFFVWAAMETAASDCAKSPSSTNIATPSLSPSAAQEVLVGSFGIANDATIKPPMGMLPAGYKALGAWQRKVATLVADQVMPTSNVTGTRTAKASAAAVNAGIVLLLHPAP